MKNDQKFVTLLSILVFILLLSTSLMGQTHWIKYEGNPVLTAGEPGTWDENFIYRSSIVFDGTTYHLWYSGFDNNYQFCIGYAYSSDGINWTKYARNPVISASGIDNWEKDAVDYPCVLYDGSVFHMWYDGYNNSIGQTSIGYATSPDGINWQKYAGNPVLFASPQSWEESRVMWSKVIKIDSTYHLWYTGGANSIATGYATSQDGITWNKYAGNPINSSESSIMTCQIIFQENLFKMWYVPLTIADTDIELAVSSDGINWTPYNGNPVLENGVEGTWDESKISDCTIIADGSTFKMWYSSNDANLNTGIGYATSTQQAHDLAITTIYDSLKNLPFFCNANFTPKLKIVNVGLSDEQNVMVNCIIDSAGHEIYRDSRTIDTIQSSLAEVAEIEFLPFSFKASNTSTYDIKYFHSLSTDQFTNNDTLNSTIQLSNIIDDFEFDIFKWRPDSFWVVSSASPYNGNACLRNTDQSLYENGVDSWIEFKYSFDLSELNNAYISYYTKHFIENGKDFGYVEASTDGGQVWTQLGEAYTGVLGTWTADTRLLNDFCGPGFEDVRLRFHFVSDTVAGYPALGWYIDDIAIHSGEVSVDNLSPNHTPQSYRLFDNYPNPFNAETTLRFQIPKNEHVRIVVYNVLGQAISTLVDKRYHAGSYKITWDGRDTKGNNVPSGVYFYKLEVEGFTQAKKMLLLE